MRVYVASSWRNPWQPYVVSALRSDGHDVYDFRNPPGRSWFAWDQIDAEWQSWDSDAYIAALEHQAAREGFSEDMYQLGKADAVVLVMPCGRSSHLELGYAAGRGKKTAILLAGDEEPELMYKMADLITPDIDDVRDWLMGMEA